MEEPIGIPTFYQRHIHIPLPHLALQKTAPALLVCRDGEEEKLKLRSAPFSAPVLALSCLFSEFQNALVCFLQNSSIPCSGFEKQYI